jgi:glycine cleavage system H protein
VQGDVASIGITDHAQHELGDIVYVDLPRVGAKVETGKACGSVESVKASSGIYGPISGEVVEINETVAAAPENLNRDPHGDAWLIKVRVAKKDELKRLMSAADYRKYVGVER